MYSFQLLEERIVFTSVTLELREVIHGDQATLDGGRLADMDGDGYLDWLTTRTPLGEDRFDGSNLALFVNDGKANFEFSHLINPESDQERAISTFAVGDMDGDGDQDIVSVSVAELFWDENVGNGDFERHVIVDVENTSCLFPFSAPDEFLQPIDYDADEDQDIFVNHEVCNFGFENLGGGIFVPREELAVDTGGATILLDWEDDGDLDFFSPSDRGDVHKLLLNDGTGSFHERDVEYDIGLVADLHLFDLDGDGIREVVSSSVWLDEFGRAGLDLAFRFPSYTLIAAAAIDGDQNTDHYLIEQIPPIGAAFNVHWILSSLQDPVVELSPWSFSTPSEGPARLVRPGLVHAAKVVDADADGDDDVFLHASSGVILIENHLTGDANGDNTVGFTDFLSLSANFGKAADAVWEDGDFNLDGAIDFADFLILSSAFGQTRN